MVLSASAFAYASGTGTLTIEATPVEGLDSFGFLLFEDIRAYEDPKSYELWFSEENNWTQTVELPYGTYYALVDDNALIPDNVSLPVNCRYVLRFGESPFYRTFEISAESPNVRVEEPLNIYLLSTVSAGAGTQITDMNEISSFNEYQVGENQVAMESAVAEIEKTEREVKVTGPRNPYATPSDETEAEIKEGEKPEKIEKKEKGKSPVLIVVVVLVLLGISIAGVFFLRKIRDDED